MAQVRAWYETADWRDYGHTITYVAGTQFKTSGVDTTSTYTLHRRIHANGSSTGDIYGIVTAAAFSTDTTVTVLWDGTDTLSNEALTMEVGADPTNQPALVSGWQVMTALTAFTTETEIEVTISAGYDYRIEWYDIIPSVTAEGLAAQLDEGGGYITTTSYRNSFFNTLDDGTVAADADNQNTYIEMMYPLSAAPTNGYKRGRGWLEMRQGSPSTARTSWSGESTGEQESSTLATYRVFHGSFASATAATAFKIFWTGGATFNSAGTYAVYRKRNGG